MDTLGEQFLDYLCRTCMHELVEATAADADPKPKLEWQSIFDTVEECGAIPITELLSNTIPQIDEVKLSDELPKKICCECLQQLLGAYRFQQICLQSDHQMRKLVAKKYDDLRKKIMSPSDQVEVIINEFSVQECHSEAKELEVITSSPVVPESSAADPLQSDDADMEDYVQDHVSDYVENASCHEDESKPEEIGTKPSPNICHICNKAFNEPKDLKKHLKQHKVKKEKKIIPVKPKTVLEYCKYKCDICNRYFHKAESLQKHRLVHDETSDNKLEPCDESEKKPSSPHALAKHKKSLKQYSCKLCDKCYKSSPALRKHVLAHHKGERFLCPECGKALTTAGNLKQHRLRHSDDKPFECPYCPMRFRCTTDVFNHKIMHIKTKSHICDICGAGFPQAAILRKHKKIHSGIKPFKCEYCEMRFVRMTQQRCHMRTHTGEKPYKCKYCDRAYAQSGDHIKHLRTHLGDNVYRCEYCPLAFRLASELRIHFSTHKNEDPETRERNMKALKEEETKLELKLAGLNGNITKS